MNVQIERAVAAPSGGPAPAFRATTVSNNQGNVPIVGPIEVRSSHAPRTGWRAAARILSWFGLTVACLWLTHVLVNAGIRRVETSSLGVSNRIVDGRINAEVVISGSSRAFTHYDPRVLAEVTGRTVFNIGINGSQTDMQLARLRTYLQYNRKPVLVIHNLDLFSFVTTKEVYDPGQYLPYLDEPNIYRALAKINSEVWKWKYLPLYGYAVEDMRFTWAVGLLAWTGWNPQENLHSGFLPRVTNWTGDFEHFKAANPDGVRFPIEAEGVRQLDELVGLCRDQEIEVVLAYSPVYHEMQGLERNRAEVFQQFEQIAARHGAVLWDFSDSSLCRNRENFYNSQHLNERGAALFSRELAERLTVEQRFVRLRANRGALLGGFDPMTTQDHLRQPEVFGRTPVKALD